MAEAKILLVEDDPLIGELLSEYLHLHGFDVTSIVDGQQAAEAYQLDKFDLCILDVMLPTLDGISLAKAIKMQDDDQPLLFLTAKSQKIDLLKGFAAGGDDYLVKPVEEEILLARIRAILRRSRRMAKPSSDQNAEDKLFIGSFEFYAAESVLRRGEQSWQLPDKESQLLTLLCHYQNRLLPREVAMKKIWQRNDYFSRRSMDVVVSKLRKYFADQADVQIVSIRNRGLKLLAPEQSGGAT